MMKIWVLLLMGRRCRRNFISDLRFTEDQLQPSSAIKAQGTGPSTPVLSHDHSPAMRGLARYLAIIASAALPLLTHALHDVSLVNSPFVHDIFTEV